MPKTDREIFAERAKEIYPGKRLLAVQLNGFSHTVFLDGGSGDTPIETERVTCAPEQRGNGTNTPEARKFFSTYPNWSYQNNAIEICYLTQEERLK